MSTATVLDWTTVNPPVPPVFSLPSSEPDFDPDDETLGVLTNIESAGIYSGTRALAVFDCIPSLSDTLSELHKYYVRGGDFLGSPPRPTSVPDFETRARNEGENADSGPAPGGDVYVPVTSTPEQLAEAAAFFDEALVAETKAERPRARLHGPIFSLMQYRLHPVTGRVLWTQEQIDAGIQSLLDDGYTVKGADIWHGLDRLLVDTGNGVMRAIGELKPLHWHGVLWVVGADLTARQISDRFRIPLNKVRLPRDLAKDEERDPHKGRGSAERAFFDFCEYLVHENARARDEEKYPYPHTAVRTWCS